MPNAVPPPASDADRVKMESAVSSAAASPAPSVASSKDDKVKGSKSTGDAKDKDAPESSVEDSVDTDLMDVDKKPSSQSEPMDTAEPANETLASDDLKMDLSEKLQKELKKEEAEEADAKDDTKDNIGEVTFLKMLPSIRSATDFREHVYSS